MVFLFKIETIIVTIIIKGNSNKAFIKFLRHIYLNKTSTKHYPPNKSQYITN